MTEGPTLRARLCRLALTVAVAIVVPVSAVAQSFAPVRINTGGPAVTDSAGQVWAADKNVSGGSTATRSASTAIAGTVDDALYRSERYGNFSYNVPVPNGTYAVTLKFAEIYWTSTNARRFNVSLEGQSVLSNFDVFAVAPGALRALDRTFQTTVTDGTLNITFVRVADNATIAAIQVVAAPGTGTPAPTPTLTQVTPNTGRQGVSSLAVTLTGTATNFTNASVVTFSGSGVTAGAPTSATPTSLTVPVTLTAGAALGARTVTVTTGAQVVSMASAFTVTSPPATPALTLVNPNNGRQGVSNLAVTLTGAATSFTTASVVTFSGSGVTAGAPTSATPTNLTVPVTLTAGAALGARTVTVTTGAQVVSLAGAFTVTSPPATPTLTQVTPNTGRQGVSNLAVTLTGTATSFTNASVVTFSGSGVTAGAPTSATATSLTVPVTLTASAALGARTVTVTTGAQVVSLAAAFTVTSPPPPPSDLNVRVDLVGRIPTNTNPTSPVAAGSQLLLVDQAGWIYRWDGASIQPLLNPSLTPAGLSLLGGEAVLNVAANTTGTRVYVMFTSSTVPGGIPTRLSPRPGVDAWQVLYGFDFNGTSLANPAAITAFQVRSIGHTGGGLVVLSDGSILFATGDSGDNGEDGRSYAQDASNHLSKILRVDPSTGVSTVVAVGVRNVQRLTLDPNGGDALLVFTDIGGRIEEELDSVRVADLLAAGPRPNFGWGRNSADAKAREGTSYIGADGFAVGSAPVPESGFRQPVAQFNRGAAPYVAVSGPVRSTQSFSRITSLMGDLVSGSVYGIVGAPLVAGQNPLTVNLVDNQSQPVTLAGLAGGRPDPRFFTFPDGTAGVLLERTGDFYRLTESGSTAPPPPFTTARANSYDSAWKTAWVNRARTIATAPGKTAGFVLQLGDALTYSSAYGMWARQGQGKTPEDTQAIAWARATTWGTGSDKNGWYLSGAGTTAMTGLIPSELLSGCCNAGPTTPAGPTMPTTTDPVLARQLLADPIYTRNRQIDTIIAAFSDAQFAVVMLGTTDPGNPNNLPDLAAIVDKLEAQHIVPILSTIPPRSDAALNQATIQFNAAVTALAQARSLPLIDFYQEILMRRPGTSWLGTLVGADALPTGDRAGFTVSSNPYTPGGDPATRTTGDALLNVGYLLRTWLTVQKLAEVKAFVVDGVNPP